jgi:ABC-type protease/lipase transport system fused ATPase/permease subunit
MLIKKNKIPGIACRDSGFVQHGSALDSQGRAPFKDIVFLPVFVFCQFLQKPWLPLTAAVR